MVPATLTQGSMPFAPLQPHSLGEDDTRCISLPHASEGSIDQFSRPQARQVFVFDVGRRRQPVPAVKYKTSQHHPITLLTEIRTYLVSDRKLVAGGVFFFSFGAAVLRSNRKGGLGQGIM